MTNLKYKEFNFDIASHFRQCIEDLEIPNEWRDVSYPNDVCPSFVINGFHVYIDHADQSKRELPDPDRFYVFPENYDDIEGFDGNPIFSCLEFEFLDNFLETHVWTNDNKLFAVWHGYEQNKVIHE